MGLFNFLERQAGDSKIGTDQIKYGKLGQSVFDYGTGLTNEGLGDLRNLSTTYQGNLAHPLGVGPNSATGIFSRARGALTDTATRATGDFGTRLFQQARQGGGNLSPEAQAELQVQNQRDVNQSLFEGNAKISDAEASLTLSETSKLFDRIEGISKTILGVGTDSRLQGLQAILNSLSLRTDRMKAIAADVTSVGNVSATAGYSAGSSPSTTTGKH